MDLLRADHLTIGDKIYGYHNGRLKKAIVVRTNEHNGYVFITLKFHTPHGGWLDLNQNNNASIIDVVSYPYDEYRVWK